MDPERETPEPDARFSFANERTFLAWGRTSVALIATGMVVGRVLADDGELGVESVAGLALILLGFLLTAWAFKDYRARDVAIRKGDPIGRTGLPTALVILIAVTAVAGVILVAAR